MLIEDCAHAPGAEYNGQKLGTFGDISAWSFFSNKNIAVGGGTVVTRDPDLYQKCRNLRSHGMTVASYDRIKGRAVSYDVLEPGFNYRIDEIHAALRSRSTLKLEKANARRKAITLKYFAYLDTLKDVSVPFRSHCRGLASYHIMPVLLNDNINRMKIIEMLKEDGIQTSIHYPSIQSFTAYRGIVGPTPIAQHIADHELTLPIFPTMTEYPGRTVCHSLRKSPIKGKVLTNIYGFNPRTSWPKG